MSKDTKYITLKLPETVVQRIDELTAISRNGYTSRTDVVKHAVRVLYDREIQRSSIL